MCICLADILDADHDLSRKGIEKNPLETYWLNNKSSMIKASVDKLLLKLPPDSVGRDVLKTRLDAIDRETTNYYQIIFGDIGEPRTQHKIHGMFVQLINLFGPKFQDIDRNDVPRTALSVTTYISPKSINDQRKKINEDYEINDLMVETHRGGDNSDDENPVFLHKYIPSTIFDLGSNAGFLEYNGDPDGPSFSLNYFPESTTIMTTIDSVSTLPSLNVFVATWVATSIDKIKTYFASKSAAEIGKLPVLIHKFKGSNNTATYSIQFGQVTADQVTYELFGANRRSKCGKVNWVKNMILSIPDCPANEDDILARQCHIIYGKTCGDGVSIDGALLKGCGVLSNDICCCYRAAIVNGYGFRPCPTASGFFSATRNIEFFKTKETEGFDRTAAEMRVNVLFISLKDIDIKIKSLITEIDTFTVTKGEGKLPLVEELFNKKKTNIINVVKEKVIPLDLNAYIDTPASSVPENILKRYGYYTMDQCLGTKEFYGRELRQFTVDMKSNIEQIKKITFNSRASDTDNFINFQKSLSILAKIEHVLSSFIPEDELEKYSKLFFNENLARFSGRPFLEKFLDKLKVTLVKLNDTSKTDKYEEITPKSSPQLSYTDLVLENPLTRLSEYITNYLFPGLGEKRSSKSARSGSPESKRRRTGLSSGGNGDNNNKLLSSFLIPIDDNDDDPVDDDNTETGTGTETAPPPVATYDFIIQFSTLAEKNLHNLTDAELIIDHIRVDARAPIPSVPPVNDFYMLHKSKQPSFTDGVNNTATSTSVIQPAKSVRRDKFKFKPNTLAMFTSKNALSQSAARPHLPHLKQTRRREGLTSKKSHLITSKSLKSMTSLHLHDSQRSLHHSQSQTRPPWRGGTKKKRRRQQVLTKKKYTNPKN